MSVDFEALQQKPSVKAVMDHVRALTKRDVTLRHMSDWQPSEPGDPLELISQACVQGDHSDDVYLNETLPEEMAVHELLHIVLAEEGYPDVRLNHGATRRNSARAQEFEVSLTALVNKVTHPEIYRRMEQTYGLSMREYRRFVSTQLGAFSVDQHRNGFMSFPLGKQMQVFNLLDLFHLQPESNDILRWFERNYRHVYAAADGAMATFNAIGFASAEHALKAAQAMTQHVIDFGQRMGDDADNDLWRALEWFPSVRNPH